MGISFKVSKTGRRFRPKPPLSNAVVLRANDEDLNDAPIAASKQKTDAIAFPAARKLVRLLISALVLRNLAIFECNPLL